MQMMYHSTALDALAQILIEEKKIIAPEEFKEAVQKAHDISVASVEEAQKIISSMTEQEQNLETSPPSNVMTI